MIKAFSTVMIFASAIAIILPLSLSFWFLSIISSSSNHGHGKFVWTSIWIDYYTVIYFLVAALPSPIRWFLSIFIPILVTMWGHKRKSLDKSGAALGKSPNMTNDYIVDLTSHELQYNCYTLT